MRAMDSAGQSENPQEHEGYKPTILPTRPVNRGFIPERRKRRRRGSRQSGS